MSPKQKEITALMNHNQELGEKIRKVQSRGSFWSLSPTTINNDELEMWELILQLDFKYVRHAYQSMANSTYRSTYW